MIGKLLWANTNPLGDPDDYRYSLIVANTQTAITVWADLELMGIAGDSYAVMDYRLSPDSPCIDAGNNSAVPEGITTDLDGNPRFLDVLETPDTGHGALPVVDLGAYESLGGGCLALLSLDVVCHGDGTTFTVNVEGLNACTGGTTMATFTGSGGAVGEDFCATLIVNSEEGGFCCSTELCVPVPDCSPSPPPCPCDCADPPDGVVNILDFLALLAQWGGPGSCDCGDSLDVVVDVLDFLSMLATWGPCP